jgi:hypothetical protein
MRKIRTSSLRHQSAQAAPCPRPLIIQLAALVAYRREWSLRRRTTTSLRTTMPHASPHHARRRLALFPTTTTTATTHHLFSAGDCCSIAHVWLKLTARTDLPQLTVLCIPLAALTRAFTGAVTVCTATKPTCFIQATLDELPRISYRACCGPFLFLSALRSCCMILRSAVGES